MSQRLGFGLGLGLGLGLVCVVVVFLCAFGSSSTLFTKR